MEARQFEPYLSFNRNCAEAMKFYETTLGAKREMSMTFGEAPDDMGVGPADKDLIMHASILLNGCRLMGSDTPPGMPYQPAAGFMLTLTYDSVAEAKRIFDALSAGGKVTMPMVETFWVESFGMATDRFGVTWAVNGGKSKMG